MKRSPKLLKFTGKRVKLNNDENAGNKIQYGIHHNTFEKNKKVEAKKNFEGKHVLPHELRSGDKIVFSTKLNQESKSGVVQMVQERSVVIGVCENAHGENFLYPELSRVITVLKGDFHEIRSFN